MEGKWRVRSCIVLLLFILLLTAQIFPAAADDTELLKDLPGQWNDVLDDEGGEETRIVLTLDENGSFFLYCYGEDGGYAYSCAGTWSFELIPDATDRLTLYFTWTDDPSKAGTGYSMECVYEVYAEGWEENDTRYLALIFTEVSCDGVSPFEDAYGFNDAALYKVQRPNMRVANCKEFVSLREKRSTSSKRLAKVPLGALVLAFPEYGEENGFIWCSYHDQYGYILAEYLEPAEY